jgi:hypothetical protein
MNRSAALANLVSAEDAAVYGYGIVVGQLSGRAARRARRALREHEDLRSRWATALEESGESVPTPQVAYAMPFPVYTAQAARALAATIDVRLVGWYADLAAFGAADERGDAVQLARVCATRAVSWGGAPQAFPGEDIDSQAEDE